MPHELAGPSSRERRTIHGPQAASSDTLLRLARGVLGGVFALPYLAAAALLGCPGISFRLQAWRMFLRSWRHRRTLTMGEKSTLLVGPMDSVRYFEFDFVARATTGVQVINYLDVSSPRLLPVSILLDKAGATGTLINPDSPDLSETRRLVRSQGLTTRCTLSSCLAQNCQLTTPVDLATSISVLEHIPEDTTAVGAIWEMIKPGGRLVLTLPCRATPLDEYADFNQYGLLSPNMDGLFFWQRYYSARCLQERIFSITGSPERMEVYGERHSGVYFQNVRQKMDDRWYPIWREPYFMARHWTFFPDINSLPGVGVVGLLFIKPL